jgi:hypothetical protein
MARPSSASYTLTGVEPNRQKVLIRGGVLKDDTDLSTLNAKPGQAFTMMGPSVDAAVITAPKDGEQIHGRHDRRRSCQFGR